MPADADFRVLLVCLGNICRSPTAEAALRRRLDQAGLGDRVEVDSAGTAAWNVGSGPDPRMVAAGAERGLDVDGTARQVAVEDFGTFDLIVAMDRRNRDDLVQLAPDLEASRKVRLLREFEERPDACSGGAASGDADVPDPYGGGRRGFRRVVDMVMAGADGLSTHIAERLDAAPAVSCRPGADGATQATGDAHPDKCDGSEESP